MSAKPHPVNVSTHGGHTQDHHGHDDHAHGTLRDYMIGFFASVVLTVIPFWLVMGGFALERELIALLVMAFAVVQIVVHMVYFLHMNTKSEGGWNMLALLFTVVITVIMLAGSLWVMYHLNTNMMPMGGEAARGAI